MSNITSPSNPPTPSNLTKFDSNSRSSQYIDDQNSMSGTLPKHIDLAKWEDAEFTWSGTLDPKSFSRLDDIIIHEHQATPIEVSCQLSKSNNITWLKMSFAGNVWVTCQRCLTPLAIDVTHDADLALLYDESQKNLLDDDVDYILLDEATADEALTQDNKTSAINSSYANSKEIKDIDDYLSTVQVNRASSQLLPLAKLIEDELLLDVPLSPKHDDCEMILDHVGEIEEEEEESPFAALAALKGKL